MLNIKHLQTSKSNQINRF